MITFNQQIKQLELETISIPQNFGDINLEINIDNYDDNYRYFFEFACPRGKKYISPPLVFSNNIGSICVPQSVFTYTGKIFIQLVKRDTAGLIVEKSFTSSNPIFEVKKSIDAEIEYLTSVNVDIIQHVIREVEEIGEYKQEIVQIKTDITENTTSIAGNTTSIEENVARIDEKISDCIINGDIIETINAFGDKKLFITTIDDFLQAADARFEVTATMHKKNIEGQLYPIRKNVPRTEYQWTDSPIVRTYSALQVKCLFDADFETNFIVTKGHYAKIKIYNSGDDFVNYPYGYYLVNYYYTQNKQYNTQIRTYNNLSGVDFGWHNNAFELCFTKNNTVYEKIKDIENYKRNCIEFIVYADDDVNANISGIQWLLNRASLKDISYISKFLDTKLFGELSWEIANGTLTIGKEGISKNSSKIPSLKEIYPVGSVYSNAQDSMTSGIEGSWTLVKSIDMIRFWKRTS